MQFQKSHFWLFCNFSSEAEHVNKLVLIVPQCSFKVCSFKKNSVHGILQRQRYVPMTVQVRGWVGSIIYIIVRLLREK